MSSAPPSADRPRRATSTGAYREATLSAVIFGVLFGAIMNAAITYAGLKIGFTIGGSAIAAVLGFGVLRGILLRGSILETNIGQTIASAVNTTNAGVIFTVPVLLLLAHSGKIEGFELSFASRDFWMITLACVAGALLGCVFIVPLRKQMLDIDRLRFPSAVAVAAILKSPGAGAAKSVVLAIGILVSIIIYLPAGLPAIRNPARLDQLDSLLARERISAREAELTRELAGWIDAKAAPEAVVQRGEVILALRKLREQLESDPDNLSMQTAVHTREAQLKELAGPDAAGRYSAQACIAAFEASTGKSEWDALRALECGWAGAPLWGYQDLGIRLRSRKGPDGNEPIATDRDGDKRPDLVVTDEKIDVGRIIGLPDQMAFVFAIAPFALGAGYLTGRAGLMVLAGGILAYFVLNPLAFRLGYVPETIRADQVANYALGAFNRPLGIGLLLGGAMMGVLASLPAIREAIKSIITAGKTGSAAPGSLSAARGHRDELNFRTLLIVGGVAMVLLLIAAEFSGQGGAGQMTGWLSGLPVWLARALIVLIAAAWIWFAGIIIAQCTGMTDWSPISGMSLLTVVLVMMLSGKDDVVSAVMLGAALCVAISCAADMMADLKTGYIVGGIPRRQQALEIATAALGPVITMATLVLIAGVNMKQYGAPIGPDTPTAAPQAQALEVVIEGVKGGELPYTLYGLGAALGALLGMGAFAGLGVLVGLSMYLPFFYILTYGVGCVANIVIGRIKGRAWAEEWGVPFCAGLIVGEAILALLINAIVLLRG
ncbi:MAG: OPT/YSL family transporter [Phycisphaeraceae bacterium]|nr:OPT/YSL family transporter [Phycisphaeraceae bacterium]